MDFESAKEESRKWTEQPNIAFELIDTDDNEKRLVFSVPVGEVSFYITGPKLKNDKISWLIWSDSDKTLTQLHEVLEYVDADKERTLTQVLNKANEALTTILGADAKTEDSDQEFSDYYDDDDFDAEEDSAKPESCPDDSRFSLNYRAVGDGPSEHEGNPVAVQRLVTDMKAFEKANGAFGVVGTPRGDNLFVWDVKLTDIPKDVPLGRDLQQFSTRYNREPVIYMEMLFQSDYPMSPPFVRVLRPRFKFLTGHVTIGGSICMEMLTRSGWTPSNDIEGILVQIRCEIMSDPNTRLDLNNADRAYDAHEAKTAFDRMVQKYGWNK